ncbi:MAG: methylamine utilization protein [Acidobacteria bacterium]|nr:MAG: methylamine utilization protein [Acidobacteriota bacterium]
MRFIRVLLAAVWLTTVPVLGAELTGTALVSGKPAQHAVVWLEAASEPPAGQTSRVVLDQRNLTFSPHVLAVRVGTTVEFPNNDKVFHNVFSFRDGKKFDLGMYPKGMSKRIVFDRPGLARLFCNIHPNMAAYVMAIDTPYFAVANERGAFNIAGVPPGTYTYHAWRPGGPALTGSITVDGSHALEIRW